MRKRLRTALLVIVSLALLGGALWNDKGIAQWRGSLVSPRSGELQHIPGAAPGDVARYVDAFCSAEIPYLAAHTSPDIANAELIADYFAGDPVTCATSHYLGSLVDNGATRYVFVLDYGERQDWLVLTFQSGYVVAMRRG
jgi:hypothetical protein